MKFYIFFLFQIAIVDQQALPVGGSYAQRKSTYTLQESLQMLIKVHMWCIKTFKIVK